MGGYNGIPDDEDRELGARIGRPPAPSAVPPLTVRPLAPPAAAPAPPAAGSTEDLEAKGQELRMAPKTGPIGGGPQAPPSPTGAQPRTIRSMWHDTGNIQSKPLRTLGRIGVGALGALDIAGGGVMEKNAQAQKEKDIQDRNTQATTGKTEAETAKTEAETHAIGEPKPKEENWAEFPLYTDNDGTPLLREQNSGQVVRADNKKPPTGFKAMGPKVDKPDNPEQQLLDAEAAVASAKTPEEKAAAQAKVDQLKASIGDYAKASQRPEKPGAGDARADRSYQLQSTRLDKLRMPVEQIMTRVGRLNDTLAQKNPQADALIAPELLSIMSGVKALVCA